MSEAKDIIENALSEKANTTCPYCDRLLDGIHIWNADLDQILEAAVQDLIDAGWTPPKEV